MMVKKATKK